MSGRKPTVVLTAVLSLLVKIDVHSITHVDVKLVLSIIRDVWVIKRMPLVKRVLRAFGVCTSNG